MVALTAKSTAEGAIVLECARRLGYCGLFALVAGWCSGMLRVMLNVRLCHATAHLIYRTLRGSPCSWPAWFDSPAMCRVQLIIDLMSSLT